jgi:hypothetical protein
MRVTECYRPQLSLWRRVLLVRAQKRLFDSLVEDEYQQKGTEVLLTTTLRLATLDKAREVFSPDSQVPVVLSASRGRFQPIKTQ